MFRGTHVILAKDGAAVFRFLGADEAVDLIVTDVGLAGVICGHRLAEVARATHPGLKVLFITGHADEAGSAASIWCAGIEILPKPSQVKALVDRVGAMLGGYPDPLADDG